MEVHLQLILEELKSGPDKISRRSRFRNIYVICLCYSGMACRLLDGQTPSLSRTPFQEFL